MQHHTQIWLPCDGPRLLIEHTTSGQWPMTNVICIMHKQVAVWDHKLANRLVCGYPYTMDKEPLMDCIVSLKWWWCKKKINHSTTTTRLCLSHSFESFILTNHEWSLGRVNVYGFMFFFFRIWRCGWFDTGLAVCLWLVGFVSSCWVFIRQWKRRMIKIRNLTSFVEVCVSKACKGIQWHVTDIRRVAFLLLVLFPII